MRITFELPDEDAQRLQAAGVDLAQRAKEVLLADLHQADANHWPNRCGRVTREPYDPGNDWELLGSEIHEGFAANGLTRADFEDAVRGVRPLPKSEKDRLLEERIRGAKNTEPNVVVHRGDIIFVSCGDEQVPTLRQFLPKKLADKMVEEWKREMHADPVAFRQRLEALHQKAESIYLDLTSRFGRARDEAKAPAGPRDTTA